MSQFMVAPTDDIMRIFGGDKLFGVFNSPLFASLPDDEPLDESKMLTKRITGVQKQVEGRNFDVRKHILEYDDVLNQHRLVMYGRRNRILENTDIHGEILATLDRVSERLSQSVDLRDDTDGTGNAIGELVQSVNTLAGSQIFSEDQITDLEPEGLHHSILQALTSGLQSIETRISPEDFTHFEKSISLATIDEFWMNHIDKMAHLREEVAFEGYAQKQPLVIYKERAYEKFAELMTEIDYRVIRSLLSAQSFTPVAPVEIPEHLLVLERSPEPEVEIPTLDGSPIVSGGR